MLLKRLRMLVFMAVFAIWLCKQKTELFQTLYTFIKYRWNKSLSLDIIKDLIDNLILGVVYLW